MSLVHFIELLLVVGILLAVGIPLFGKISRQKLFATPDEILEEYKHLLVRKEEVLISIKELETDLQTDKISKEDHEELRQKLESEGLEILKRIDELEQLRKQGRKKQSSKNTSLA